MKRLVCFICLLGLLLSACSFEEHAEAIPEENYDYGIYQLTFKEKNISNDSVGNDWLFTYTYNSKPIKSGYRVTQSLDEFSFQSIDVEVREKDKIDDVGIGTLKVAICGVGSGKTEVTVTETDGRFKGNAAVWEISCEVKMVGKQ